MCTWDGSCFVAACYLPVTRPRGRSKPNPPKFTPGEKGKFFFASRRGCVLQKLVPAGWPSKCHFGTIRVCRGEHPSLNHNFKHTFSPFLS